MRAEGDTSTKGARDCNVFEGRHSSPQSLLPIQKVPRNINSCVTGFVLLLASAAGFVLLLASANADSSETWPKQKQKASRQEYYSANRDKVSREMKCYYERTTDMTKEAYTSNPEPKRQAVKSRYTKLRN